MPSSRASSQAVTVAAFPAVIVSGGQTGADRAALDFAIARGIEDSGFCSRGRKAEDGPIPEGYQLAETKSADYPERTRLNVELGDATAIFAQVPAEELLRQRRGGSALTAREAARAGRPFVVFGQLPERPGRRPGAQGLPREGQTPRFERRRLPRILAARYRRPCRPGPRGRRRPDGAAFQGFNLI